MSVLDLSRVTPGFTDPIRDSQRIFRAVMTAMSRPGLPLALAAPPTPPAGLDAASAAIILTVADFETPVWLDPALVTGAAAPWVRFHCGAPLTDDPSAAAFAIAPAASSPPLAAFNPGDSKYPDRSTTLVLMCEAFVGGPTIRLEGPGVDGAVDIAPLGLADDTVDQLRENRSGFQCGVDLILTTGSYLIGLPRSTRAFVTTTQP
ncbi:phosphonate C-P lyase system protein PhnH [bacterium]|nr:phosphonate C-P lyase system protein PhnH [bacterium]